MTQENERKLRFSRLYSKKIVTFVRDATIKITRILIGKLF